MTVESPLLTGDQLVGLEERWRRQGAPIVDHLQPGLSEDQIDALVEPLGLTLPAEARRWWAWHDGVRPHDAGPRARDIGPWPWILSIREAVDACRRERKMAAEVFEQDLARVWWRPSWFPIAETDRGAIRFDCSVDPKAPAPVYWAYSHDFDREGLTKPRVGSIGALVDMWIKALDSGAWRYDSRRERWVSDLDKLPGGHETGLV